MVTHFSGSGFNNQIHQFLNGLAVARALNRTYCLAPFVRRKSDEIDSKTKLTSLSEIFDLSSFSEIASIENIEKCIFLCEEKIGFIVNMSPVEITKLSYERQNAMANIGFKTNFNKIVKARHILELGSSWLNWLDEFDVQRQLLSRSESCVELYHPFPASKIITDGELKFLPSTLKFSRELTSVSEEIAFQLFENKAYISVHWRYEYQLKGESKCKKKSLPVKGSGDICFVIFLKKVHSDPQDYLNFGSCIECEKYLQYVQLEDVGSALQHFQAATGINEIFLASDADPRVLKRVGEYVHYKMISDSELGRRTIASDSMEAVSVIEQALCARGTEFVGTSYSTWTTTVWMLRSPNFPRPKRIFGFLDFLASKQFGELDDLGR